MSHEIFHCFGSNHDRANSRTQHPYGHGLQVPGKFRTIMAYSCASSRCPRIPYLSANGYKYNGVAMGDSTHDNARLVGENTGMNADLVDGGANAPIVTSVSPPIPRPVPRPVPVPRPGPRPVPLPRPVPRPVSAPQRGPRPATVLVVVPNPEPDVVPAPQTVHDQPYADGIAPTMSQCHRYPSCALLNIDGVCCPTVDGVYMDCCSQNAPSPSIVIQQDSNSTHWWWKTNTTFTTTCTTAACAQTQKLVAEPVSSAPMKSFTLSVVAAMASVLASILL